MRSVKSVRRPNKAISRSRNNQLQRKNNARKRGLDRAKGQRVSQIVTLVKAEPNKKRGDTHAKDDTKILNPPRSSGGKEKDVAETSETETVQEKQKEQEQAKETIKSGIVNNGASDDKNTGKSERKEATEEEGTKSKAKKEVENEEYGDNEKLLSSDQNGDEKSGYKAVEEENDLPWELIGNTGGQRANEEQQGQVEEARGGEEGWNMFQAEGEAEFVVKKRKTIILSQREKMVKAEHKKRRERDKDGKASREEGGQDNEWEENGRRAGRIEGGQNEQQRMVTKQQENGTDCVDRKKTHIAENNAARPVAPAKVEQLRLERIARVVELKQRKPRVYKLLEMDIQYCEHMIREHGNDYGAMSRDPKNIMCDPPASIQRKLRIYRDFLKYQNEASA
ncbi:hypothetical protein GPALN_012960 [Globodera pallida]|nr:hypothetical protein GPALN_012960 [Globodera pallida]